MSTKKPKRRVTRNSSTVKSPRRAASERPVSDKRVAGEIMGALLAAITFGALETA